MLACTLLALVGCSTRETKQALAKANDLASQEHYDDANAVLIDALKAREDKVRASTDISPTDPAAIDALTKKVQSDPEILKMERAQIPLYLKLQRSDLAAAVYADIIAGHPGDQVLIDMLKDKDPKIRTRAVRTMGLAANPNLIDSLVTAMSDPDEDVRSEAVSSLGMIDSPKETVPPLIHALNDTYSFVRSQAADALEHEKDASAINPLLDTVSDPDPDVESSAENALANLCQLPGVSTATFASPFLIKAASSPDVSIRLHAVKGLGETGDPSVIPTLRQTLKDPEVNVRGWSMIGLDKLKDTGSLPALQAMANDPNETTHIRQYATLTIQHLTGQTAPSAPASK
jgi:HEAT repeat protein